MRNQPLVGLHYLVWVGGGQKDLGKQGIRVERYRSQHLIKLTAAEGNRSYRRRACLGKNLERKDKDCQCPHQGEGYSKLLSHRKILFLLKLEKITLTQSNWKN
jgi:hypothetical protein